MGRNAKTEARLKDRLEARQCSCGRWFTIRGRDRALCFKCEEGQGTQWEKEGRVGSG
jgi:hypothetical protein